jgi:hypothetical protein
MGSAYTMLCTATLAAVGNTDKILPSATCEARAQPIADTGLTFNRHTLVLQVSHIAVHRALGHLQPLRQKRRRGQTPPTNELDDLKQAIGAAHGI